ncbi:hypothetical protein BIW11_02573 [Tropilaelaps mercedesae]|uniref:Uncharacterized protein n=1 Tax=Tropilaelaps mercedesae TaxID=418985 RepID=A0A1V9Y126_9ACAR|nr:hypothetical protein BIW11_02573 [Tropilaelaps mercedesae]
MFPCVDLVKELKRLINKEKQEYSLQETRHVLLAWAAFADRSGVLRASHAGLWPDRIRTYHIHG